MIDCLARQGYLSPSSIQTRVIPKALRGGNIVAQSETGSGKTHAFLIPIIENLQLDKNLTQAIIIAPTRELAKQIYSFAEPFKKDYPRLHLRLFVAGQEKERTFREGMLVPHIIIGTPTRLKAMLIDKTSLDISNVKTLVLDEADMLMEMGYFAEIDIFYRALKMTPQVLVFSA
ncbi:MAG: DEAD/DEAH box helicase, partial [Bacilli bacterium]